MEHAIRVTWLRDHHALATFEVPMQGDEQAWALFHRLSGILKAAHPEDWPRRETGGIRREP
jgi:hypothetical protein